MFLARRSDCYQFFEELHTTKIGAKSKSVYLHFDRINGRVGTPSVRASNARDSAYGYTWRAKRGFWDRMLGVWSGELIVKRLSDGRVLGIRRGYFLKDSLTRKMSICPRGRTYDATYQFVKKVIIPPRGVCE